MTKKRNKNKNIIKITKRQFRQLKSFKKIRFFLILLFLNKLIKNSTIFEYR